MKIDFYTANEQNAPTVENFLFSDEYAMIMNGMYIDHNGQNYQVTGQQLAEETNGDHIVFLYPVNRRPAGIIKYDEE